MDNRHIVVFDGVCNVCNGAVNFIIKRDPASMFAFTPMQSDLARELWRNNHLQC
jgi:predicted DCC family thiol-disulfide oxidoreductase YuxK